MCKTRFDSQGMILNVLKTIYNHSQNVVCTYFGLYIIYIIHIVVEVTMNMAECTSSWQSVAGAAEECQYFNQL